MAVQSGNYECKRRVSRPSRRTSYVLCCLLQVEALAKTALTDAVEILVGGRSVVNKDITQKIEIRPEAERFLRLLEVLGAEYENGKILIFVASQDQCDNLFRDLLKVWSGGSLQCLAWCVVGTGLGFVAITLYPSCRVAGMFHVVACSDLLKVCLVRRPHGAKGLTSQIRQFMVP